MNNHVTLRRNIKYAALQGCYWMVYCVAASFAGVFLLARGYSNTQLGVILAVGNVLGFVLQPLVAGFADRTRRFTPTAVLAMAAAAAAVFAGLLLVFPGASLPLSACFVGFIAAELALQPLVNAYTFYLERSETPIAFGIARGIGSLAYAALAALLGFLTAARGVTVLPLAALSVLGLLFVVLYLFHREGLSSSPATTSGASVHTLGLYTLLTRYRSMLFLLMGIALLFFGHSLINNFLIQIVAGVGGTSAQMGTLQSYAALLELPAMFFFDRLHKKFSCAGMLKFAALFFVVKNVAFCFASSIPGLYLSLLFQALSFAVLIPASVRYAHEVMDAADANKAQSFVTAMILAGNVLSSALGGLLIDRIGMHSALCIGAAIAVLGAGAVIFGMKKQ